MAMKNPSIISCDRLSLSTLLTDSMFSRDSWLQIPFTKKYRPGRQTRSSQTISIGYMMFRSLFQCGQFRLSLASLLLPLFLYFVLLRPTIPTLNSLKPFTFSQRVNCSL